MQDKKKHPKKRNTLLNNVNIMDYLVIICIATIQLYIGVSLYQYYKYDIATSDLTSYIFTFFGGELLAMATIQIKKKSKNKVDENSSTEEEENIDE